MTRAEADRAWREAEADVVAKRLEFYAAMEAAASAMVTLEAAILADARTKKVAE